MDSSLGYTRSQLQYCGQLLCLHISVSHMFRLDVLSLGGSQDQTLQFRFTLCSLHICCAVSQPLTLQSVYVYLQALPLCSLACSLTLSVNMRD